MKPSRAFALRPVQFIGGATPEGAVRCVGRPRYVRPALGSTCVALEDVGAICTDFDGIFECEAATHALVRGVYFPRGFQFQSFIAPVSGDVLFVDCGALFVWKRARWRLFRTNVSVPPKADPSFRVSADGSIVVFKTGTRVDVFRVSDGAHVRAIEARFERQAGVLEGPEDFSVSLSRGGRFVLLTQSWTFQAGSGSRIYDIFDVASGEVLRSGHAREMDDISLSRDGACVEIGPSDAPRGRIVLAREGKESCDQGFAREVEHGEPRNGVLESGELGLIAPSLDGKQVALSESVWTGDQELRIPYNFQSQIAAVALEGSRYLRCWDIGIVVAYDTERPGAASEVFEFGYQRLGSRRGAFSPNGSRFAYYAAMGGERVLLLKDTRDFRTMRRFRVPSDVAPGAVAVTNDGRVFVGSARQRRSATDPAQAFLDAFEVGRAHDRVVLPDGQPCLQPDSVVTSGDGRVVLVRTSPWGPDPRGFVHLVIDGLVARTIRGDKHVTAARAIAVSQDGTRVAIATMDTLRVWTVEMWHELAVVAFGPAAGLAFAANGCEVHARARDTTLTTWPLSALPRHSVRARTPRGRPG